MIGMQLMSSLISHDSSKDTLPPWFRSHNLLWLGGKNRNQGDIVAIFAFNLATNRTSIGICVHDEDGTYVLAKTLSITPMTSTYVSEALGLFYVLQWLHDMRMDSVDFVVNL